jgi:23S rRNA pseudouridine1911/1915/1917 synthase
MFSVNHKVCKKGTGLSGGDELAFRGPENWLAANPLPNESLDLPIVHEDEAILVLDKPAGVATHGFSGRDESTLANFLAAERPELLRVGKIRWEPGLMHRLDSETSGLVLVAKTQAAFVHLQRQFRLRRIKKTYLALVWGNTDARSKIEIPLAHDERDRRRMTAILSSPRRKTQKMWEAITHCKKLCSAHGLTLLEIAMETGVTHQIRVHLAAIGHPIVADALYGEPTAENFGLTRHFLHAWKLVFEHPDDGRIITVHTDLPVELRAVLSRLTIRF